MNSELKRSVYYSAVLGFFGGLWRVLVSFILTIIAIPRFENLMVPKDSVVSIKFFSKLKEFTETNIGIASGIILGLVFYLVFFWRIAQFKSYPMASTTK